MNKGIAYAAGSYVLWGLFPIYFKLLKSVPAFEIIGHRFVWSFFFLIALVLFRGELRKLISGTTRKVMLTYLGAGLLLAVNWTMYVWAVNAGHVVESSLGYFINPLVSVLLGVIFLRERLRPLQWLPIGLAAFGVLYLTLRLGAVPWISLVLAFSFGFYGLVKKIAPLNSLHGLTLETGALVVPAFGYLLFLEIQGSASFVYSGWNVSLLLALTGVVTAVPLLLYASGAHRLPLTILGLLQYIAPTLQFLLGVLLYGEPFTADKAVGFAFIWLALGIFSSESFIHRRKTAVALAG